MHDPAPWHAAKKILAIRLDSLGDVLMTTPAFRALRETFPGCEITLLTSPEGAQVAQLIPDIQEVLVYDAPWMKSTHLRIDARPDREWIERLKERCFDGAIVFTVFSQNPLPAAMLAFLCDIPLRLAYCRENPYQLVNYWVPETEPERGIRHEVQRQLDLVAELGATTQNLTLSLKIPHTAFKTVLRQLRAAGIDPFQRWVVIHPGATASSRRYPPESYSVVAREISRRGVQVVFTGQERERRVIEQIRRDMQAPSFSLGGRLTLAELSAVIAQAAVVISNNTGPAHIAAAVGTPVVDLYALTNPQHTPWHVLSRVLSHDVLCKYCYKSVCPEGHNNCLRLITPDEVVRATNELLEVSSCIR